jgi:uncharacterized protein (TIGR00288 family)
MANEIAIYLDLDNLVIGARQLNLPFDIHLILDHLAQITRGRFVLRRAYGDYRQDKRLLEALTTAGFITQSTVALNSFGKNLADMQLVVDAMESLVEGRSFDTYVLMTGDRDFTPLVQSLHKHGKQVIGVGIKHAASSSLVNLCDQYVFYEELMPAPSVTEAQIESLLARSLNELLKNRTRVRASVLKQHMNESSNRLFDSSPFADTSFRQFLARHKHLAVVQQEGTTTYVQRPPDEAPPTPLHLRYRSELKRRRLRVPPAGKRLKVLKDIITQLVREPDIRWRQLIHKLSARYKRNGLDISRNLINSVMLVARRAQVIHPIKGKSLAAAPLLLQLQGDNVNQEAIIRCDAVYLKAIKELSEPFDLEEAALALYQHRKFAPYLEKVLNTWMVN